MPRYNPFDLFARQSKDKARRVSRRLQSQLLQPERLEQRTVLAASPVASLAAPSLIEGSSASADVDLLYEPTATTAWTATSNASWLHVAPATASGMGSAQFEFYFDVNSGDTSRTGTITIGTLTLTVTQVDANALATSTVAPLVGEGVGTPFGFSSISGIATDSQGNVYFSASNNTINEWSPLTNQVTTLVSSGISGPTGVAVDGAGDVFFGSGLSVKEWNASTGNVTTVASSQIGVPDGVAVDNRGNLFILGSSGVFEVAAGSTQVTTLLASGSGLFAPEAIAVDNNDNLYFADTGNNDVKEYSLATKTFTTLVPAGVVTDPRTVAVDGSGNVYFTGIGNNSIEEWSALTGTTSAIYSPQFLLPNALAVDPSGNVYFGPGEDTSAGDPFVEELAKGYVSPLISDVGYAAGSSSFSVYPGSLSIPLFPSSDQTWLVVNSAANGQVTFSYTANTSEYSREAHITVLGEPVTITQDGMPLQTASVPPLAPSAASLSTYSVVEGPSGSTDTVLLAEASQASVWSATSNVPWLHVASSTAIGTGSATIVFSFDANPSNVARAGTVDIAGLPLTVTQAPANSYATSSTQTLATGLTDLYQNGVVVDALGNVFYDTNTSVLELSPAGVTTTIISGLKQAAGLAVDPAGNVYVADNGANTVYEWNATTRVVTALFNNSKAQFFSPQSIAVDTIGNVYYTIPILGSIYEWNRAGKFFTTLVNTTAIELGQVAVDASGNVYFTDTENDAIDEYSPLTLGYGTIITATSPLGVAVDVAGNVYYTTRTSTNSNSYIEEWSPITQTSTAIASSGFFSSNAIAVDPYGDLVAVPFTTLIEVQRAYVSPPITQVPNTAGSGALTIMPDNLTSFFTPTSDEPWLTLGTDTNGQIVFNYTANTSVVSRSAQITVLGQIFTVSQDGESTNNPLTGPTAISVPHGAQFPFNGVNVITLSSTGASTTATESVTLTATIGTISLSTTGVVITAGANNSNTITISGTVAALNSVLGSLVYTAPDFGATSTLTVTVANGTLNPNPLIVAITLLDVAPVLVGPITETDKHGANLTLSGANAITVSDIDAAGALETVSLNVDSGSLSASLIGTTIVAGAQGSSSLTISGTIASLNATLSTLVFTAPDFGAISTLTAIANDGQLSSNPLSVVITLTESTPSLSGPISTSVTLGASLSFDGGNLITAAKADALPTDVLTSTLSVGLGTLAVNLAGGATVSSGANNSATLTLSGSLDQINEALATLTYAAPDSGLSDFLTVSIGDSQVTSALLGVVIALNNVAPTISAPSAVYVAHAGTLAFTGVNTFSISDVEAGVGVFDTVSLSVPDGTLAVTLATSGATLSGGANNSGSLSISGDLDAVNAALATLTYTAPATGASDTLSATVKDGVEVSSPQLVSINELDAPPALAGPSSATIAQNGALAFTGFNALQLTGSPIAGESLTVALAVSVGSLNVDLSGGATIVSGLNSSGAFTLSGSFAQLNAALATLTFGAPAIGSSAAFTATVNNGGLAGTPFTLPIQLTALSSSALSLSGPRLEIVPVGGTFAFTSTSSVQLANSLPSATSETVILTAQSGAVAVTLSGSATISAGASGTSTLTISGSPADVNATLATLSYTAPTTGSQDSLSISAASGAYATSLSIAINLTPSTSLWQNPSNPLDVGNTGTVSPLDVLLEIAELNSNSSGTLTGTPTAFYDVLGTGTLSPFDALTIIAFLEDLVTATPTVAAPAVQTASASAVVAAGAAATPAVEPIDAIPLAIVTSVSLPVATPAVSTASAPVATVSPATVSPAILTPVIVSGGSSTSTSGASVSAATLSAFDGSQTVANPQASVASNAASPTADGPSQSLAALSFKSLTPDSDDPGSSLT